ncbi:hypothetical protein EB001_09140 [bacterium]|nr:hypothetical protein [bacterium]
MGLADRLKASVSNKRTSHFCAYIVMYNELSPQDKKALDEAWEKGYSNNTVLQALRAEGIKSSNESIRAHRTGMCKCLKS